MLKMFVYVFLLVAASLLIVNCDKDHGAANSENDTSMPVGQDDVTKYKRKGMEGKAITIIPPVDYEHLEETSQKFREK